MKLAPTASLAAVAAPPIAEAHSWIDGRQLSGREAADRRGPGGARLSAAAGADRSPGGDRRRGGERALHRHPGAAGAARRRSPPTWRLLRRGDRGRRCQHHRGLQPGLLPRPPRAGAGRRGGDPAAALLLQPPDVARHAGHRRATSALPARARRRAGSGRCGGADRAHDARHRAGDAQQPDRRHLSARM